MWPWNILNSENLIQDKRNGLWPAPQVSYGGILDLKMVEGSTTPVEPVALQDFKDWGKIDVSDDDSLITEIITTAREMCEAFLNISLIPRSIIAIIDNSNGNTYFPYGPVVALTSITDYNGNAIATEDYRLEMEDFKRLAWPYQKYIRIEYTAGYTTIPRKIKTGILQQILWLYQHRGDELHLIRTGSIDVGLSPEAVSSLAPFSRNV